MKYLRIIIIAFILVATGVYLWITAGSDAGDLLLERLNLASRNLALVVMLLFALTLLSTLTGLPVFYLNLAMGFILTFVPALLLSWAANIIAVMATYYMVRLLFLDYFREKYGKKKLIRRINKRIAKYGMWTVTISRGIYIIPTSIINFSFPLSKISPRSYLLGTTLGLIPECLIGAGTGYLIKHGISLLSYPETGWWKALMIGAFILLATLLLILLRIRQLRRKKFRRLKVVPYEK
ncbi:MAG: VTT domain-containing protein [Bacteroidales bacterium]